MDDAEGVTRGEPHEHLSGDALDARGGEGEVRARVSSLAWVRAGGPDAEEASEVATGAELEDEDDGVSEGVVVEEAHDVGGTTGEVLQGLELAEEVIGDALVRRADHHAFQGDVLAGRESATGEHLAEGATAQTRR